MKKPAGSERASRPSVPPSPAQARTAAGAETVTELCARHVAAQPDPRTAATYRSRLRAVRERYGALTASDALAQLGDIERELTAEHGTAHAHKALTLLTAALRDAGLAPLTLVAAAQQHGLAAASLRELADSGRVRYLSRRRHGRGEAFTFDPQALAADLARLPPCLAPGCQAPGTGPSGYCGQHFGHGGREGARKHERDLLGHAAARDWYTLTEAAKTAGRSPQTLRNAIARDELPAKHVGRHVRIPKAALADWLRDHPSRPAHRRKPSAAEREVRRQRVAELAAQGHRSGAIAQRLGSSKPTVLADLDALGLERPGRGRRARVLAPAERAEREQRVAQLYREGRSLREVAHELGSSATQIRRDLEALDVSARPQRRPAKYPPATERPCEHCGNRFTPRAPADGAKHGGRRFCTDACARDARRAAGQFALRERGLLGTAEVAHRLNVGMHSVDTYIHAGLLKSQLVWAPGALRPVHGIGEAEVRRFEREWARGDDGRRRSGYDPAVALARAERDGRLERLVAGGLTEAQARAAIVAPVEERRRRLRSRRGGRKPGNGPPASHWRWRARFDELQREMGDEVECGQIGPQDATPYRVAAAVAQEDWLEHPEDWPRDKFPPAPDDPEALDPSSARAATDRVWKALKRLQNAQTRIVAA